MKNTFFKRDIVTASDYTKVDLNYILPMVAKMKQLVETKSGTDILKGRILTALFYEPSSRTFGSFVAAMQRLGGGFIPLQGVSNSSVVKGETLPDTVQTFASYTDAIVIRHPDVGSAQIAAEFSEKPVINAGDGIGEHPTQAIQDLFTISDSLGKIEGMHIVMVGDLAHYRPVNSLTKVLTHYQNVKISFISPPQVKIQKSLRVYLQERNMDFAEYEHLDDVIADTDVLYVTRVKKEYMSEELYKKVQGQYVIDKTTLAKMKKKSIVMHPFPRVGEIAVEVDLDERAVYLRTQMKNGMYTRMALLASVLLPEVKV